MTTDQDPLLRAGRITCSCCGRVGLPVDAVWVPGELILASFEHPCSEALSRVVLVDPALLVTSPELLRPREEGGRA